MGFREFLRDEMEYQGLTVRSLAEKAGVSKRTIDNYLKKSPQEPSVTNAYKIARALHVSIEYLLTGQEYNGFIPITGQTLELIECFDSLTDEQRKPLLGVMKALAEQNEK